MDFNFDITLKNRAIFKRFLESISLENLNKIPEGFNNNIFWNIAHVVVTQQLLVYKLSGLDSILTDEFIEKYKKGTKSEHFASQKEVDFVKNMLFLPITTTQEDYQNGMFKSYNEYTVSTGSTLVNVESAMTFNNFHEGIHLGYILAQRKVLGL